MKKWYAVITPEEVNPDGTFEWDNGSYDFEDAAKMLRAWITENPDADLDGEVPQIAEIETDECGNTECVRVWYASEIGD